MSTGNNIIAELQFLTNGMYRFKNYRKGQRQDKFVTALDAAAAFTQSDHDSGWMPAGLKRSGYCAKGQYYVYFTPAAKTKITVVSGSEAHVLNIPLPSMVMLGIGNSHYLAAIKEKTFSRDALTCIPPLPNVYDNDARICWGSNTPLPASVESAGKSWRLFIESNFNNHLSENKIQNFTGSLLEFLIALNNKQRFPMSELRPMNNYNTRTVERWADKLIGKK